MAKRVQLSADGGTTWLTLPGSTAERQTELEPVKDTVFGQNWESEQPNIGKWMITANSFFKGISGYTAVLKSTGTSTAMTTEAMSLVSGKTYRITNAARRCIDYNAAVTVFDNAVNQTANVESIDYLSGQVTFKSAYTVTGPVTITGNYLPLAVLAKARSFQLTQTMAEVDNTDYETAQANGGWRTFDPTAALRTVKLECGAIHDAVAAFTTAMATRALLYIEVSLDGAGNNTVFRGMFKRTGHSQKGDVGALEEATYTFSLWVPDGSLVLAPFRWYFTNSTLNGAVQAAINAFQNQTTIPVRYLPDGSTGHSGTAIVTEASLANSFDGQNEFNLSLRGTGAMTTV